MDSSPPGSPIPGILQARTLEWAAISFSSAHVLSRFSPVQLWVTPWTAAHQAPLSTGFFRQEYWSGLPFPSPLRDMYLYHFLSDTELAPRSCDRGAQPQRPRPISRRATSVTVRTKGKSQPPSESATPSNCSQTVTRKDIP